MSKQKIFTFLLLFATILSGCGGDLIDNDVTSLYSVKGLLFHNPNDNNSFCYSYILKEGEAISALTSYIVTGSTDSTQLAPLGGGAYLTQLGALHLKGDSTYYFHAGEDFGSFYYAKALNMADTFRVQVVSPASHEYSGGSVSIQWNPPSQDFGYFVTVEPPSSQAAPFTAFANTTDNFSIPAEAFAKTTGERVPGIYYIYVVAYSETFYADAVIKIDSKIFFPYPSTGFTDNVNLTDVKGRFGSAIMSYRDSIEVLQNP